MQFVIEIARIAEDWRLQADGSWRNLNRDLSVKETDRRFGALPELRKFQQDDIEVSLSGRRVMANPSGLVNLGALCEVCFRVIREQAPRIPTRDELRRVIRQGNDRTHNTLVIDADGHFRLKPWTDGRRPLDDLDIAVRMETYAAGNGYVGPNAAADAHHIDRVFRDYLYLWVQHIETGRMNIHSDGTPGGYTEGMLLSQLADTLDQLALR